jgi:hypothetical protein
MGSTTYELTMSQFTQITQSDLLTVIHFCKAHQVVTQQSVMKVKPTQFAESPLQNIVCLMLCMLNCFLFTDMICIFVNDFDDLKSIAECLIA